MEAMAVTQKLIVIGLLLLATLLTGIWLGQLGKPLSPALSTVHKLLGLAWVIFSVIRIYHAARLIQPSTAQFAVIAILGVLMVALIASGSVLTIPKLASATWLNLHRIASAFAVIATAAAVRPFILSRH